MLTWCWGNKYSDFYIEKLHRGVARHLNQPFRFAVVTDRLRNVRCEMIPMTRMDLLKVNDGCYVRLQMFDHKWRDRYGLEEILNFDLDVVVTGALDPLADSKEPFKILRGGHFNPCPVNGSVMLVKAGAPENVWSEFNVELAERNATKDGTHRGTDQTWIALKAPDAAGWTFEDGIYSYLKPGWPKGDMLPKDARVVAFPGKKDPSQLLHLDWVRKNWC